MTPPPSNDFDEALSRRLAKLGAMPVDTSALERAVKAQIAPPLAPPAAVAAPATRNPRHVFRAISAVAASLVLVALVALTMLQSRSAQASPDVMLQLHRDIVSGKIYAMPVDSVADVNEAFKAFWTSGIQMSAPPEMALMKCCLQDVGSRKVGCVLLKDGNVPVTLTIAQRDAVKPIATPPVTHNGEAFHVTTSTAAGVPSLTMITVDRGNYRICLIGELPAQSLMELSGKLKF